MLPNRLDNQMFQEALSLPVLLRLLPFQLTCQLDLRYQRLAQSLVQEVEAVHRLVTSPSLTLLEAVLPSRSHLATLTLRVATPSSTRTSSTTNASQQQQ